MRSRVTKVVLGIILSLSLVVGETGAIQAQNTNTKTLATDVSSPSSKTTFAGAYGKYVTEAKKVLARLNEIRLEACEQGVPNPEKPSKKLTKKDYVPLQWSSDLEYMARIRAAEASVYPQHDRPNGKSCFTVKSPHSVAARAEVLAWNTSDSMLMGIEQWYDEKEDWVKQNDKAVTGHYTSIINPKNTYVGIGTFLSENGYYSNTTCGRFAEGTGYDTAMMPAVPDCMQIIEVVKSALSAPEISPKSAKIGYVGRSQTYSLTRQFSTFIKSNNSRLQTYVPGHIKWTSSRPAVASVDSAGNVKMLKTGKTKITAVSDSGTSASFTLEVVKEIKRSDMKKTAITKVVSGKKKLKVKWKKIKKNTMGYEIQYSTSKKFRKNVKIKRVTGYNKTSVTLKKLKSKKKYYVRVRTYYKMPSMTYYSAWSKAKNKKVK